MFLEDFRKKKKRITLHQTLLIEGLKLNEASIIGVVEKLTDGWMMQTEMAELLNVNKKTIFENLKRLRDKGYIQFKRIEPVIMVNPETWGAYEVKITTTEYKLTDKTLKLIR